MSSNTKIKIKIGEIEIEVENEKAEYCEKKAIELLTNAFNTLGLSNPQNEQYTQQVQYNTIPQLNPPQQYAQQLPPQYQQKQNNWITPINKLRNI